MEIRKATENDVTAVAEAHLVAFPEFFLTSLGIRFLRELYSGFLTDSSGIFFVADQAGEVVGFVAGTSSPDTFFPALRRRRGLFFAIAAVPAVLRNPMMVVRKLYAAVFYRGDQPTELENGALLSSIGVIPKALGSSIGRELLQKFEADALCHGAGFVYLTTDEIGNERVNAFYRKCGYHEESRYSQHTSRPMLRYVKQLRPINDSL